MILLFLFIALSFAYISPINRTESALNNAFALMNITLPKTWVALDEESPLPQPLFDVTLVENSTIAHFKNNLVNVIDEIKVGFYYFDEKTLEEKTERYVSGVRVSLGANINDHKYYRASDYVISKTTYAN